MRKRLFVVLCGLFFVGGCMTTRPPSEISNLQIKVAQLERKLDQRDEEILNLQSKVQTLSNRVDRINVSDVRTTAVSPASGKIAAVSKNDADDDASHADIIRVPVSAQTLQTALRNAGYYDGAIDGKIGSKSQSAIRAFQTDHDLKVDGIVGRNTWASLKNYLE